MRSMAKVLVTIGGPVLVAGCALPMPVAIMSYALDSASYATTGKSMTDHGLSAVLQQDCAIWRGIVDGELCRKPAVVATGMVPPPVVKVEPADGNLGGFVTAAGQVGPKTDTHALRVAEGRVPPPVFPQLAESGSPTKPDKFAEPFGYPAPKRAPGPSKAKATARPTTGDTYYVIGSFIDKANADHLANHVTTRQAAPHPKVVPTDLNDGHYYRVVVGPVRADERRSLRRRLAGAGLDDAWPLPVL